ncbi:hypothetical protein SAMN05421841_3486 [Chryseobacterium wanjuense]|uniref:Uncharacterized protein n=1 Tax=Chryseobacterium wanjuense TaxID=356305 RepID=A0A1I0RZP3_9FLAO|nr:hypothetical protein [Chryseobacterium wanjuense]SEW47288.1 hypothetical protein SAMN05421841_3486 [Chryseobacterium wanjuense]
MKKRMLFISSLYLLGFGRYEAQIGIQTSNPQGTFHIDGAKDNAATGVPTLAQQANDVAVTPSGNVGIGTVSPSVKLEVTSPVLSGAIKIVDGSQGAGKVLTSDSNGVGSWSPAATAIKAVVTATTTSTVTTSSTQGVITYFPTLRLDFPVSGYYSLSINPHIVDASTARDPNGYVGGLYLRNTTTLATIQIGAANVNPGWPYGNYGYRFASFPFKYVPAGNYELGVTTLSTASAQQSTFEYYLPISTVVAVLFAQ